MHLKLDDLIHSIEKADNQLIWTEYETDEELANLKRNYEGLWMSTRRSRLCWTSPQQPGSFACRELVETTF